MTDTSEQALAAAAVAPRVTEDGIRAKILSAAYHRLTPTLTVCVLTLANGFTVLGQSACASPENFNEEIGNSLAHKDAFAKIWAFEGYLLREQLATDDNPKSMDAEMQSAVTRGADVQLAKNQASGSLLGAGMNDDGRWLRERALEMANRSDDAAERIVKRAAAFLAFLRGEPAASGTATVA